MTHSPTRRWAFLSKARKVSASLTVRFLTATMSFTVMLLWARAPALAQEGEYQEEPTPTSVEESVSPIERSFVERVPKPGLFPWVKEQLKDTDPFLRDTAIGSAGCESREPIRPRGTCSIA